MKLHCREIATSGLNGLFVLFGVLVYATSGFREGAAGLPVGPRAPDADTGVSVDRPVYNHGKLVYHGDADGTSKYSHLGRNPKPAVVDGSLFVETKTNLESGVSPKPGDPSITGHRLMEDKTSMHRLVFHYDEIASDRQRGPRKVGSEQKSSIAADKSGRVSQEETDQDEGRGRGDDLDGEAEQVHSVDDEGTGLLIDDGGQDTISESGGNSGDFDDDGERGQVVKSLTSEARSNLELLAGRKRSKQAVRMPGKDTNADGLMTDQISNRVLAQPWRELQNVLFAEQNSPIPRLHDNVEANSHLDKDDL